MSLSQLPATAVLPLAFALAACVSHASGAFAAEGVRGAGLRKSRALLHPTGNAAASKEGRAAHAVLAAADVGMVKPLRFDQRLLVCNAYPSESPMLAWKNGKDALADAGNPIAFGECRNVSGTAVPHDKLDFSLRDVEIHGSFEISEQLPSSDAILLLVLGKRADSKLLTFQSLAFPTNLAGGGQAEEARLAIIDTYRGNSSSPRLKMQDHITGKEEQTVSKRVEELSFDRVYSIEPGQYDASVIDRRSGGQAPLAPFGAGGPRAEAAGPKVLQLAPNQNYVVIRTGTSETGQFPESLLVFPDSPLSHSRRFALASWWLQVAVAAVAAAAATTMSAA